MGPRTYHSLFNHLHLDDIMPRTRLSSGPSPLEARYPQSTTHQHHGIQTGCILWLPKKDDIDERLLAGVDIEDGCFNHPIVVLSTNRAEGKATVLIVSIPAHKSSLRSYLSKLPTDNRSLLPSMAAISPRGIQKTDTNALTTSPSPPVPLTPTTASCYSSTATFNSAKRLM